MDADADLVVLARPDIKQMADNVNIIKDAIELNTATNGQILKYNSTTGSLQPFTLSSTEIGWTKQQYISESTLTASSTVNWDLSTNQTANITLNQNVTIANPTNQQAGGTYVMLVKQDATGGRTLSWGTDYLFVNGLTPTVSTAANAVDLFVFYSDGTKMYGSRMGAFA